MQDWRRKDEIGMFLDRFLCRTNWTDREREGCRDVFICPAPSRNYHKYISRPTMMINLVTQDLSRYRCFYSLFLPGLVSRRARK